jgi:apolipoprotein N-acyltransferase
MTRWLSALLTGLLFALGFPLTESFGGLPWLAWGALIPLGLAIRSGQPTRAFRHGWLAGTVGYTIILSWVVIVMQAYGHLPFALSLVLLLLLAAYVGLYVGLFAAGWRWLDARWPRWGWLLAPAL